MRKKHTISRRKKGFTLTELAVVIAVIAILIAVLVPTFIALLDKAKESNDMVYVKNLNTAVSLNDASGDIGSVSDALDAVGGSVVSPTSEGNVIVYDQDSRRFALVGEDLTTIVYKDTSTTKTDFSTSTTWVFVEATATTAKYVEVTYDASAGYTIKGSNSYVLMGENWNGASVTASYGVELYDKTGEVTLNKVTISNTDTTNQAAKAAVSARASVEENNIASLTEDKIESITVNVKSVYLTCTATVYTVKGYGSTTKTELIGCNYDEYGVALTYDATEIGNGKLTNYNPELTEIVIKVPTGKKIADIFTDKTNKVTLMEEVPENIDITIEGGKISIEAGSVKYPYTISCADDMAKLNNGGYYKLTASFEIDETFTITAENVNLDLGDYTLSYSHNTVIVVSSGASLTVKASGENGTISSCSDDGWNCISNSGTLIVESGNISGYTNAIYNDCGTVIINGGTLTADCYNGIYNNGGYVTVNDGTLTGNNNGIYNDDNIYDENNNVTGNYTNTAVTNTAVTINGGTLTCNYYNGIWSNGGSVTVNGGDITGGPSYDGDGAAISCNATQVTITGGDIKAFYRLTTTESGKDGDSGIAVYSGSTLNITGGNIYGLYRGLVVNNSECTIGAGSYITATGTNLKDNWLYGVEIGNKSDVTIEEGATISVDNSNNKAAGIIIYGSGDKNNQTKLTINGGTIYGSTHGITGDSLEQKDEANNHAYSQTYIYGGTIEGGKVGIFQPHIADLTISGNVEVKGKNSAIEIRSGTLNISGGTFIASSERYGTKDEVESETNYGETTVESTYIGAAIVVSQGEKDYAITVEISGGTFNGCYGLYETDTEEVKEGATPSENVSITISGGTFKGTVEGYKSVNNKITTSEAAE